MTRVDIGELPSTLDMARGPLDFARMPTEYIESAADFVASPVSTPLEILAAPGRCDRFPGIRAPVRGSALTVLSSSKIESEFSRGIGSCRRAEIGSGRAECRA
jgi:hypothetical protein